MHLNLKTSVGELHALKYGNDAIKPTIVFLHESLGCTELWRDFPKKLGALTTCNVLVYDRLGYGKSNPFTTLKRGNDYLEIEADILMEVLKVCNIDKAILFGHSDGGSIAMIAAAKYPTTTRGQARESASQCRSATRTYIVWSTPDSDPRPGASLCRRGWHTSPR